MTKIPIKIKRKYNFYGEKTKFYEKRVISSKI